MDPTADEILYIRDMIADNAEGDLRKFADEDITRYFRREKTVGKVVIALIENQIAEISRTPNVGGGGLDVDYMAQQRTLRLMLSTMRNRFRTYRSVAIDD